MSWAIYTVRLQPGKPGRSDSLHTRARLARCRAIRGEVDYASGPEGTRGRAGRPEERPGLQDQQLPDGHGEPVPLVPPLRRYARRAEGPVVLAAGPVGRARTRVRRRAAAPPGAGEPPGHR